MHPGREKVLATSLAEIRQLLLCPTQANHFFFHARSLEKHILEEVTLAYNN